MEFRTIKKLGYHCKNWKMRFLQILKAKRFVSQTPKLVDAILQIGGKILFIEFKNGKIKDKQNDSIVIKILESLLMFCDIADCKISQVREVADLILVYNAEKNPSHSKSFKNFADEIGELTR